MDSATIDYLINKDMKQLIAVYETYNSIVQGLGYQYILDLDIDFAVNYCSSPDGSNRLIEVLNTAVDTEWTSVDLSTSLPGSD